jgi:hypothetical protein
VCVCVCVCQRVHVYINMHTRAHTCALCSRSPAMLRPIIGTSFRSRNSLSSSTLEHSVFFNYFTVKKNCLIALDFPYCLSFHISLFSFSVKVQRSQSLSLSRLLCFRFDFSTGIIKIIDTLMLHA